MGYWDYVVILASSINVDSPVQPHLVFWQCIAYTPPEQTLESCGSSYLKFSLTLHNVKTSTKA